MTTSDERIVTLLRDARRQLETERSRRSEPIAIVGIGCRFPGGASSPDAFWRLLCDSIDATSEVPRERWDAEAYYDPNPDAPGKAYTKRGAFLDHIDAFDADFFGISPREAVGMDPQQRLLLEVVWEALEDASILPSQIKGTATGVWVGLCVEDYARRSLLSGDPSKIDAYSTLGNLSSVAAGRISYLLDLRGPTVQLDTACSSSLVAIHQACQSLRVGETDLALVGGVNLMSAPEMMVAMCKLRALAPDGRCKTFDASADGYGRGEGCGMVVLERLSDALAAGRRIYAVVRGSAINHDGHSNGLTAPNGLAQETVLRAALANARVDPRTVGYVEAHGTGTLLGDPIEVLALSRVYGRGRSSDSPLYLGAVKTNFGHLEGAAGIAGLIKIALCLSRGQLVPHLHLQQPNPKIPWGQLPLRVASESVPWLRNGVPRFAGVSSFGISGTNAHVVLEEAPEVPAEPSAPERSAELLVLSAKTPEALDAVAGRLREHLERQPELDLGDVAYSLLTTRALLEERLTLSVGSRAALLEALRAAERGETPAGAERGSAASAPGKLAWLFTGQGAQRLGMGKALYGEWAVFRAAFDEVCALFDAELDEPLREVMWALEGSGKALLLDQTGYTQPALFALEWALSVLWRSWGVEPELLLGHSIGELTAAAVAGVFSLEDAVKLVGARARLMQGLPAGGAMLSIAATEAEVREVVGPLSATVSVAAVNGPASVVISGDEADVATLAARWSSQGVKTQRLTVSHAFHSPRMEPMLEAFRQVAESLRYQAPRIALVSDTTGTLAGEEVTTAEYWVRHVRETVRFAPAVQALSEAGAETFLELGPRATLLGLVSGCLPEREPRLLASLRTTRAEPEAVLEALGGWVAHGGKVDSAGVFPDGARRVPLPTYPWQRNRFWVEQPSRSNGSSDADAEFESTLNRLMSGGVLPDSAREALPKISSAWKEDRAAARAERIIGGWTHALEWRPFSDASQVPAGSASWVVLGPSVEANVLSGALNLRGRTSCVVENLEELSSIIATQSDLRGVVHVLARGVREEEQVLAVERLLASAKHCDARAWWITRGAVGTGTDDPPTDPDQAVIWGLGRTFALEHPKTWGGLVDLGSVALEGELAQQVAAFVLGTHGEDQVALRGQKALVPRVRRQTVQSGRWRLSVEGTVLITGGLGGLGLQVARWLARRGTRHLLLVGRQGANTPGADRALAELENLGAKVTIASANVSDRAEMEAALLQISRDAPLVAVFHTAGISDRTPLEELTIARLNDTLRAKLEGTRLLSELTKSLPLEAFVCFSSIAGVWGSGQQAAYAASNCFLDAWAQHARAAGVPASSISWGPWLGGGMADDEARAGLSRRGLEGLDPDLALNALDRVLADGRTHTIVADVNWPKFRVGFEAWSPRKLLAELDGSAGTDTELGSSASSAAPSEWLATLAGLPSERRTASVSRDVREAVARILSSTDASKVPLDKPLKDLGLDSLMAVELRTALSRRTGLALAATLAFDYPTCDAITQHLLTRANLLARAEVAPTAALVAPDEPIAIVGIGCRFPGGVSGPDSFWQLLAQARDVVGEMPRERWDVDALYDANADTPGKMTTREGGFLRDIDRFDPSFFGISPREARKLDPQQRLLLETSWEALESSGIRPDALAGSSTGVFVGLSYHEYGTLVGSLEDLDGYAGTGNAGSVASGRISYVLGLQGPSMTVDTACSSSLVTLHLACQALRAGECSLALAGGVTLMLTPVTFVEFSRLRGLSPDGRCRTFSADANGTGWAEGCGMLVLERLSDARKNGHPVLALIRGSAVNQDGRSNGLTAPNGPSQEVVIADALRRAGVLPADVSYVECHGTATTLGDPIEVQALGTVLARGRAADHPVWIGSVKSNFGHTQAAAGAAGVIKTVLALQHGLIPKSLHFAAPNPHIAWSELPLRVASESVPWLRNGVPRFAGVSSFGISGTNAHVVLEEAPEVPAEPSAPERSAELLVLSAKTPEALDAVAGRLREHLERQPELDLGDVAYSLLTTRALLEERLTLSVGSRAALLEALRAAERGETPAGAERGSAASAPGKLAWLFTGQGAQRLGMGKALYGEWAVFRAAFDEVCALFDAELDEPLREVMWALEGSGKALLLDQTGYTQPALFALEWALSVLWRSWGVEPELLLGHSIGELTAAAVAGVFSLEDAVKLVGARARLMQGLPAGGAMLSIAATEAEVREVVGPLSATVSVAAVNGPASVVISGDEADVATLAARWSSQGVKTQRLTVSHAFHSPRMEPMLEAFRQVAESLRYQAPRIALVSDTTGTLAGEEVTTAEYWVRHVRETVRFAPAVQALSEAGAETFLELGPRATLLGLVSGCLPEREPRLLASLRTTRAEPEAVLEALGGWVAHGGKVDSAGVFPDGARRVPLPTYPWQRNRFWVEPLHEDVGGTRARWPLAGHYRELPGGALHHVVSVGTEDQDYLRDHIVHGVVVIPGAYFVSVMLACATERWPEEAIDLRDVEFLAPLFLESAGSVDVDVLLTPEEEGASFLVEVASKESRDAAWRTHARARVSVARGSLEHTLQLDELLESTAEASVEALLEKLARVRIEWGPRWCWMSSARSAKQVAFSEITSPSADARLAAPLHPVLIDNGFGTSGLIPTDAGADDVPRLPFSIERFRWLRAPRGSVRCGVRAQLSNSAGSDVIVLDLGFWDESGDLVAAVERFAVRIAPADLFLRESRGARRESDSLYEMDWLKVEVAPTTPSFPERWLVVGGSDSTERMRRQGLQGNTVTTCNGVEDALRALSSGLEVDGILCCWEAQGVDEGLRGQQLAVAGLTVVQAALQQSPSPRLWWVTRSGVAVSAGEDVAPAVSALWGLGRTVMQEHPGLRLTLVDVDREAELSEVLQKELSAGDDESQVAWRGGQRHVARLVRAPATLKVPEAVAPRGLPRPEGTALVTGGLGSLGLQVARHFAERGVPHLLLTGRRGLQTPGAERAVAELKAFGARVTVVAVDVADRAALARVLADIPAEYPLRAIVHAAGVLDDGLLIDQTPERFAAVLAPKALGAWNLHELTEQAELDLFVMFSSLAGTLGSAGQSGYAAANAFLDGLAAHRRSAGRPALSLAWGPWSEGGFAARLDPALQARFARQGIGMISPEQGRQLFEQALDRRESQLVVALFDLRALPGAFGDGVPPLWRALVRPPTVRSSVARTNDWTRELAALVPGDRPAAVRDVVRFEVARVLSLSSPVQVPLDKPLKDLGLDSLMAVELRNNLGRKAAVSIPATLAFDYPTTDAITQYLLSMLSFSEPAKPRPALPAVAADEPIAIVGIGCRFPGGVSGPDSFWQLLAQARDVVGEMPRERWDVDALYDANADTPGKMTTREGGFLRDIDRFDPSFFGISPREARKLDPQQRLLLETSWEALESSGIRPDALAGSSTGVFVGLMYHEYGTLAGSLEDLDGYTGTGNAGSVASGRISYVLGLQGPSMTVDTACSSSLVTLHLACQALRAGECSLALAGGVTLMLTPVTFVEFSRLRGLSPDGRCRTFSADANGTGWAEGCGMLVLERLSDARKNGHPVLALIRGSAVNQDGRSNGLTAPNGPSQEVVIADALRRAGVLPADVSYVECHGTATTMGDPIEVQALGTVLARGRAADHPVWIGSVKSNFGHTQAAAGAAGVIKTVLALQHGLIPKSLHFAAPNPHIAWSELPLRVASESVPWLRNGVPRFAGVSSFGISGTNAHVVLEEAPEVPAEPSAPERSAELLVLSAKTPEALDAVAGRLREHLERQPELDLGDVAYSLLTTRALLEERLTLSVGSRAALLEALRAAERGETPAGAERGSAASAPGKLAWLFTGQGAQRLGMGKALYGEWAVFRAAFDEVCALFDAELDEPLREVMWASEGSGKALLLDQTGYTQPALFALEWALSVLWRSWGVEPELLLGHSIGELTAAAVAGVFSLEDAVKLVGARARLMQGLPAGGAMLSIAATEAEVREVVGPLSATVSVAAVNGPASVVISGDEADVATLAARWSSQGVKTQRLTVSHAFHSPRMEPMLEAFRQVAESLRYQAPRIALVSDTTGTLAGEEVTTAEYWVRHVRETVRFAPAVQALSEAGAETFLELGPRATLLGLVSGCLPEREPRLLASLRTTRAEPEAVLEALGGWVAHGGKVDSAGVFPDGARRVPLPTYPWQRNRFWVALPSGGRSAGTATGHPLLGVRLSGAAADAVYESVLSASEPEWLGDHRVGGHVVVPAAAVAELFRAAAEDHARGTTRQLKNLVLQTPLLVPASGAQRLQVVLSEGGARASLHSQPASATAPGNWTLHASCEVEAASAVAPAALDLAVVQERCSEPIDVATVYESFGKVGLEYGPAFRGVRQLWRCPGEVLAEVALEDAEGVEADSGYGLHPALLDAALQTVAALFESAPDSAMLPFEIGRFIVHRLGATAARVHARRLPSSSADAVVADVTLTDPSGAIVAEVSPLTIRQVDLSLLGASQAPGALDGLYRLEWSAVAASDTSATPSGAWRVIATSDSVETAVAYTEQLRSLGATVQLANVSDLGKLPPADHVVCVFEAPDSTSPDAMASSNVQHGLAIAQALLKQSPPPRLWWVTRSAVAVSAGEDVAPAASAVWGLGRTVMQEHPGLGLRLVDVDREAEPGDVLRKELSAGDEESQVAWRQGQRHVARLMRARATPKVPEAANYQLEMRRKGTLDGLVLTASERGAPRAGEVEIEVVASGLNFRDVLNALGMYPGEAGPLGGECSGHVRAVGTGVERLAVGDPVMALAPGAFRRFVTVDQRLVAPLPRGVSVETAATLPLAFLTAWYALQDLAHLQPGERVLIHAAAGGVGMAAVQLARWIGAEVLATASPPKWPTLRALGVEHVASSRDLGFATAFRAAGGVDVVLNSLTGEFIDASLSLLSPGGRFIEMGKTDLRDPALVASAHPGFGYRAFDLIEAGPDRIAEMFALIVQGFDSGRLTALPVQAFPITEAEAAFRFMAQARHVGKIALLAPRSLPLPEGTALVTGGLGALGLQVAREFAERGVPHLLLTSRRGLQTPGAEQAVAELEQLGARVTVAAVDVADRAALARVLADIPADYPLRTIVHAAGVLDDGMLVDQTPERFSHVLAPKVMGAWNLHELTLHAPLDLFVMFSSLAGTLGSAGQSGYAAANAFLDGLAAHRRAQGQPALSLAWGPWSDGGFAARLDSALQARFARQGIGMISPDQGRQLLEQALAHRESQLVVALFDLRALSSALSDAVPPLWRALVRPVASRASGARSSDWTRELAALAPNDRPVAVRDVVRSEVARVLSLSSAAQVPLDKPLKDLGLDSLMAVELRNALGRKADVSIPATLAFDYPTSDAITQYLLGVLSFSEPARRREVVPAVVADEPIAIVGIGCRFPGGVTDPESFWQLLEQGVDAITEVPKDRWDIDEWYDPDPDALGKMTTRWGGFLKDLDRFEPSFFGISPREALSVDPQERLLLETTWEALEQAGLKPETLMGSDTGVYMGLCGNEYQSRVMADAKAMDAYSLLGTAHSTIVGRLSYWLGLKGPNLAVDTACSSSLVTVHLACQALRNGECQLALAGGANVLLSPEGTVYFSRLRAMSPTGRCHTFSAEADGYVRSEGAGVVVLERLSAARKNGHRIWAIIRGTAVNQDGRSNGITAPNGPSQQAVVRHALARAGILPTAVSYVECHGTGTALGDPIEVQALGAVLGEGRAVDHPVVLGALKSNLGHMEGAAGVGGLIKAALSLQHGRIPKSLHFTNPNPLIAWTELPVRVASEAVDWPRNGSPRIAGVSAFGISGTNAHVVLEEAPLVEPVPSASPRSAELVLLSAKTPEGLSAVAGRLREHLETHPELGLGDVAFSLLTMRSSLEHRLPLSVATRQGLLEALKTAVIPERAATLTPSQVVFVFPGQGSQWLGMGRSLLEEEPAFREALGECDRAIEAETGWSVLEELEASAEQSRLSRVDVVQPVLFAMQVALSALWRAWGVEPAAVVGHSMGEVAAAVVAGALSLEDGAAVICRRSRLLSRISGQGEMALVDLSLDEASAALRGYEDRLGVAASNGPRSTVLSGQPAALTELLAELEGRGVFCRRVKVDVASHSPQVDPLLGELRAELAELKPRASRASMHSTVTGAVLEGTELGPGYWADNLRQPVRFGSTVEVLLRSGHSCFVEISPHPLLVTAVEELRSELQLEGVATGSLRREQPERLTLLESLGVLHVHGQPLDVGRLFPSGGRRVPLPTYPWQRERYWVETLAAGAHSAGDPTGHPLLGSRIAAAGTEAAYESLLSEKQPEWLEDHRVGGHVVVPGAALAELLRAAAKDHAQGAARELTQLVLLAPLLLAAAGARRVQVVLSEQGSRASVYSQATDAGVDGEWTLHATAQLGETTATAPQRLDVETARLRCSEPVDVGALYDSLATLGLEYGPRFRGLRRLWRGRDEALAEVELPDGVDGAEAYGIHPALLDAAMHAVAALVESDSDAPHLPFEMGRFAVHRMGASAALVHVRRQPSSSADSALARVTLTDTTGALIAEIDPLTVRRADLETFGREQTAVEREAFHCLEWQSVTTSALASSVTGHWGVLSLSDAAVAEVLAGELRALGASAEVVTIAQLAELGAIDQLVCLIDADGCRGVAQAGSLVASQGLAIARALLQQPAPPRVWWVTRSALAVTADEDVAPELATAWGLGRTLLQEQPALSFALVDVESAGSVLDALRGELGAADDESQVAWRAGRRYVARLVRAPERVSSDLSALRLRTEGTALITGGLGALGLEVAKDFAQRGVRHLLLTGRRGQDSPGVSRAVEELEQLGARVTVAALDVADRAALARALASIPEQWPLRVVVHAAAVLDDGMLPDQTPERFEKVLRPKVLGAWHLHELTEHADLDLFVMFSSVAGTLGSASQGGYAAGNAFLDALAAHRRALGRVATSLAWGPWSERGRASLLDARLQARLKRQGMVMISPERGMTLFGETLSRPESQLVVAPLDLRVLSKTLGGAVPPVWRALVHVASRAAKSEPGSWARELAALPAEQRLKAVTATVRGEVARVLSSANAAAVPVDKPLKDLGLDSLMAVELRNALARRAGVLLRATLAFDYPTTEAIAQYLLSVLSFGSPEPSQPPALAAAHCELLHRATTPIASLFCFPDGGGSSLLFAPLSLLASAGIDVHCISPSRIVSADDSAGVRYLSDATSYIRAHSDRPYAVLGHSLGACLAESVIRKLIERGIRRPDLFIPSAYPPSDSHFASVVRVDDVVGIVSDRTGRSTADLSSFRRELEADGRLWQTLRVPAQGALPLPIAAIVGSRDQLVSEEEMASWEQHTSEAFSLTVLPGDHFYPYESDSRDWLDQLLIGRILAAVSMGPGKGRERTSRRSRTYVR